MMLDVRQFSPGTVLFFVRPRFSSHHERINGVYAAAIKRGWHVQQIEEIPTAEYMRMCVKLWHPIGCLVDLSTMNCRMDRRTVGRLPLVIIGRDNTRRHQIFDCAFQNAQEPAQLAADELRSLGMRNFAFVGDPARPFWSVERGGFFKASLHDGETFHEYGGKSPDTVKGFAELKEWMRSLPLPCGCFLAADHVAATFYAAATETRIRIGADLPVISVDNDEHRCLSLTPRLSSVKLDYFKAGENAIMLLERRLASPDLPLQSATYGTLGIAHRASANPVFTDRRVTKGMAFIIENGCSSISVNDIADVMGCSSRSAEKLFHKHAGMSVLDAIRNTRLEKAFSLLRNHAVPIDAIPFQCGYAASPAYLKTYFKRTTGMTMREWRARNTPA